MASQQAVSNVEEQEQEEYDYEDLQGVPLSISMLAGSLAGISEHAFMFPVDVIRVSVGGQKKGIELGKTCLL
jgi:solute carrier family 25 iron transporter 28/37